MRCKSAWTIGAVQVRCCGLVRCRRSRSVPYQPIHGVVPPFLGPRNDPPRGPFTKPIGFARPPTTVTRQTALQSALPVPRSTAGAWRSTGYAMVHTDPISARAAPAAVRRLSQTASPPWPPTTIEGDHMQDGEAEHYRGLAAHFRSLADVEPLPGLRRHLRQLAAQHDEVAVDLEEAQSEEPDAT